MGIGTDGKGTETLLQLPKRLSKEIVRI